MLSRRLTRSIAIGATTAANRRRCLRHRQRDREQRLEPRDADGVRRGNLAPQRGIQRSLRTGRRRSSRHGHKPSTASFTLTTPAGQKVTVTKASSTNYLKGSSSLSASAIKKGTTVLVLGTTSGTTITAGQVIVQTSAVASTTASAVVPFQRGAPATSKQVGQIPASYTEGQGTIVSGTTVDKATEAALAAYPGGVVDRVVKLSNGEYEVHNIGVNWPHHVFVNQSFKVVGAD
jgi:hypothetical protein